MFGEPGNFYYPLHIPTCTHTHTHTHTELQSVCEQQRKQIVEKEELLQRCVTVVLFSQESCHSSYI